MLSTKAHGVLDYIVGIFLIAAPWLLGFARGGAETWVPVVLGAGAIVYSLLTNYELGVFRTISMRTHLTFDFISGVFLATSPWIFGFNEYVYLPHLILGLFELGAVAITETVPAHGSHKREHRHAH